MQMLKNNNRSFGHITSSIFTKNELNQAKWLTIRSVWLNVYPYPRDNMEYLYNIYNTSNICEICRKGIVQNKCFSIEKKPKWGQRNFFMLNLITDELFISNKVASIFQENNITGIEYFDVYYKKNEKINDTKQLFIKCKLAPGLNEKSIKEITTCKKCNNKSFFLKPDFVYINKQAFDNVNVDIIKSHEIFGQNTYGNLLLINKKIYDIIMKHKIDKNLVFEPVVLIDN